MKNIVWIASYPKSGSTWFRALLANLSSERTGPAGLHELGARIASSREWFDYAAGVEAAELTQAEIDRLRPRVYEHAAQSDRGREPQFHKIHDAFVAPSTGKPIVSPAATRGAIYLVRNPLDVCVSYAHHSSWSIEVSAAHLADTEHSLAGRDDRLTNQLRQYLSSWSAHVRSWLDNGLVAIHVVRYEDLSLAPIDTLTGALRFAGLRTRRADIERSLDWSRLDRLQALEASSGFAEKPLGLERFFRRGMVAGWRDELTLEQARRITADHRDMMERLGYVEATR